MDPTIEQLDKIIERKLKALEEDYQLTLKYDNVVPVQEASLSSVLKENEVETPEEEQEMKETQDQEEEEEDDEDDFGEYQYQSLEDDENPYKVKLEEVDPNSIEHKDPFDKPLEVDLIKSIMSKISLPPPPWAANSDQWKSKMAFLIQENYSPPNDTSDTRS